MPYSCCMIGGARLRAADIHPELRRSGKLAEQLYKEAKIRNIALFFKTVDPRQLRDPGEQLKPVLVFKHAIEVEKKHLFKAYAGKDEFCEALEGHLSKWLRDHEGRAMPASSERLVNPTPATLSDAAPPSLEAAPSPGLTIGSRKQGGCSMQTPPTCGRVVLRQKGRGKGRFRHQVGRGKKRLRNRALPLEESDGIGR